MNISIYWSQVFLYILTEPLRNVCNKLSLHHHDVYIQLYGVWHIELKYNYNFTETFKNINCSHREDDQGLSFDKHRSASVHSIDLGKKWYRRTTLDRNVLLVHIIWSIPYGSNLIYGKTAKNRRHSYEPYRCILEQNWLNIKSKVSFGGIF